MVKRVVKKEVKKQEELKKEKKEFLIEIVDSHIQNAVSLSQFLEFLGYKTLQAYDFKEAIRLAEENNPGVILLDLTLNGPTGKSVAEKLPNKKVILMVPLDSHEKPSKNIIAVIKKPVDNEELEKLLKKLSG